MMRQTNVLTLIFGSVGVIREGPPGERPNENPEPDNENPRKENR